MSDYFKAPPDLAQVIDPLKENFTWKWVGATLFTFCTLFTELVIFFPITLFTGHYILMIGDIIVFGTTLGIFIQYARTPTILEENWSGILYNKKIKHGLNTFSKFSPFVKKQVVHNFTGLVDFDEETGLCKEKSNKELK